MFKIISLKSKGMRRKCQGNNGFSNLAMTGGICDEIFTLAQQTGFLPSPAMLFEVFHIPQNT
jgi:hypothetical protein